MRTKLPIELGDLEIREALAPYAISLSQEQIARVRTYTDLLIRWNRSINLTAIQDPVEIVRRHFGESLFASNLLPVENCRLADVGTGAGFPGLALKVAYPSIDLILIESNNRKSAFLAEILRSLEFADVEIRAERFEDLRPEAINANIITSRAVGNFKDLLPWSAKALSRRGHLLLWVGADDATRIARSLDWTWQPAAHIPESLRRFVLIGRPIDRSTQDH
jgi:16S rRNA (guanine527-N7)-methyltransferase